jgi:hypothetical protein
MTTREGYGVQQCAEGVLVGLRRCTLNAASDEITRASGRHHLDSLRVAQALVRLAQDIDPEADSNATAVARFEWGALLAGQR